MIRCLELQKIRTDKGNKEAAETNNDEKQAQTIRVGSFEDTFNYVDKNGVRRGYGYELMQLCQVIPNGNLSM